MSQPVADRNLLFGVLAMQMDFITREQLIAAMQAWVFDKNKPLGEILVANKALADDNRALLEALVQKHLALHDNNAEKSLAAVSSVGSLKKDLEKIADQDVQASLAHVSAAPAKDVDIYATVASAKPATGMRFRILRPHAKGGLGEVFVAHDEELHREVALKEIQERQADNLESRSRFLVEAEITGGLEHPGIVPVYGLGAYADGRPYYAMRFIRGDSLKDAIERFHKADAAGMDAGQRTLALRSLLGRFVDVCDAISYAHSRGVLHRDLKPGNIMLGKYGETLVVDWGLAKPMGQPLEPTVRTEPGEGSLIPHSIGASSQTVMGSALGTPQYMSPEQAAGRHDQLGPASDVYSLGATLYCLLTGQAPFSEKDVGTVLQKVQRGDFPRPREVKQNVPLPLEAICRKAMALLPANRYAAPRNLADDIEHWLADEPVSAWPEPWTAKARRWIGRHRTLVTGTAAAVLVALVGLIVTTVLLTAANERERQAKLKAEQNFQLARAAVDRYHTSVSQDDLLKEPGMEPLRKKLLEAAREFYEKFKKERAGDPSVQAELGKATFRLAQITGELDSEFDAIKLHEEAAKLFETLPAAQADSDTTSDLAGCYHHLGRLNRLIDQTAKSEEYYKKALALWEQLVKEQPNENRHQAGLARTQMGLGNNYQHTRRLDQAQRFYEQALDNWKSLQAKSKAAEYRRDWAVTQSNLGMIYMAIGGKEPDAKTAFAAAQEIQKKLVADAPNISQYQNDLARTDFNRGFYQEAAKLWQGLVNGHPAVTDPHKTLSDAYSALSKMYLQDPKQKKQAVDAAESAVAIQRKLATNHQGVSSYQGELARSLFALGEAYHFNGLMDQAEQKYQESISIQDKLVREIRDVPHFQYDLARSLTNLGYLYAQKKKEDKAADNYKKAMGLWEKLFKDNSSELDYVVGRAKTCRHVGDLSSAGGDYKDALIWYTRALDTFDAKYQQKLENPVVKEQLSNIYWMRADALTHLDCARDSLPDWDRALGLAAENMKPAIRLPRAAALARAGEYQQAAKEVDELVAQASSGDALYRFASVYALSAGAAAGDTKRISAERQQLAERFADQAVKLLASAFEISSFKTPANLKKLKTDPDLQALRDRPAFKKLLSDLESN
jgi:serine/threonine protein kinase/tetratricopeptide (TPR) repeat protein